MESVAKKCYYVEVSDDAISVEGFGYVCDCGLWTSGDDVSHIPVVEDFCRESCKCEEKPLELSCR